MVENYAMVHAISIAYGDMNLITQLDIYSTI